MNPNPNLPFSDQFRTAAEDWADKEAAASLLEEAKSAFLAKRMADLGDIAVNKAERDVKASPEWTFYIETMCKARQTANTAKVQMEYCRMRFNEWNNEQANKRAEMRL